MAEEKEVVAEVETGVHNYTTEKNWIKPKEKEVLEALEEFRDRKFGFMMHWGVYSLIGICESWGLSDEDGREWSRGDVDWCDGETYKKDYFNLYKGFNPIRFEPKKWAQFAKDWGFKYTIFTTKHHDGFCMWDTKFTDYKVTNKECLFSSNKNADICKVLFDAFREQGLGVTAYYSKADWASPYYWETRENTRRGISYKTSEKPELWNKFVEFSHNQMLELVKDYGPIDCLWLDAGWVRPGRNEDLRLEEIAKKTREINPKLIFADRCCGGEYENYVTPEQGIPETYMAIPWESCIALGGPFAFGFGVDYGTPDKVLKLLVEIVSKGGNLALNIAPQPDGRLPVRAIEVMNKVGGWLTVNGEAIYKTRPFAPYYVDGIGFTRSKDADYILMTKEIKTFEFPYSENFLEIRSLEENIKVDFEKNGDKVKVILPNSVIYNPVTGVKVLKIIKK